MLLVLTDHTLTGKVVDGVFQILPLSVDQNNFQFFFYMSKSSFVF